MDGEQHHDQPEAEQQPEVPSAAPQDAYEAASKATEEVDYEQFTPALKAKKKWPRVIGWTLLIVVVLAALGYGGYFWHKNHKTTSPKFSQSSTQKSSQNANTAQATEPTVSYDASDAGVSFSYPKNWTVADTNGKVTVMSPAMQLTNASGQAQTGQIVFAITSEAAADFSMFKQGGAVAVLASQKVSYAKPSSTQRANTYVSFLQYAATTTHGALDGIFVTGDNGYTYGQTIPETDVTKVDPSIRTTFVACASAACSGTLTPLSITAKMWSDSSFSTPILNMVKSISLQ